MKTRETNKLKTNFYDEGTTSDGEDDETKESNGQRLMTLYKKAGTQSAARDPGKDLYLTPPYALDPLWKILSRETFPRVWECAAGPAGHQNIATELERRGFAVIATDILDEEPRDFYEFAPPSDAYDIIVTNPPFTKKFMTLQRLFALNKPFCCLFPIMLLDSLPCRNLLKFHADWAFLFPNCNINYVKYPPDKNSTKKSRAFFSSGWLCWKIPGLPNHGLILN